MELLEYIVLECGTTLEESLRLLDPLPDIPKLLAVSTALDRLKYTDGEFTLLQVWLVYHMLIYRI